MCTGNGEDMVTIIIGLRHCRELENIKYILKCILKYIQIYKILPHRT